MQVECRSGFFHLLTMNLQEDGTRHHLILTRRPLSLNRCSAFICSFPLAPSIGSLVLADIGCTAGGGDDMLENENAHEAYQVNMGDAMLDELGEISFG
jgi:hypothetical protein